MRSHACLLAPIFIERYSRRDANFRKRAVMIVVKEQAGRRIARHENVRPSVIVEVARQCRKAVVRSSLGHPGLFTHIRERPIAVVVVELAVSSL